jgi:hypothetical protein
MAGGLTRPHNEELHNLSSSPNSISTIVRMTKSIRTRWVVHVACIGNMINAY